MTRLFFFIALVTSTICMNAQHNFWKAYEFETGNSDHFLRALPTSYGYIVPTITNSVSGYKYGYVGLKHNGQVLFDKRFPFTKADPKIGRSIPLSDGNYATFNNACITDSSGELNCWCYLQKFNERGDTIWTKTYGIKDSGQLYVGDIAEGKGNRLFLLFYQCDAIDCDPYIVKLDSSANQLARNDFYETATWEAAHSMTFGQRGKLYISGYGDKYIKNKWSLWLAKLDTATLKLEFVKDLHTNTGVRNFIFSLPSGNLFIYGDTARDFRNNWWPERSQVAGYWIDTTGKLLDHVFLGDSTDGVGPTNAVINDDGSILAISRQYGKLAVELMISEIDPNKEVVRENRYQYPVPSYYENARYVSKTRDGGLIISGNYGVVGKTVDAFVLKIDSNQCIKYPDCPSLVFDKRLIGIDEGGKISKAGIKVFPNPASDRVTISLDRSRIFTVQLLDLNGNSILTEIVVQNEPSIKLGVSSLSPGIYILKCVSETSEVHTARLIISE